MGESVVRELVEVGALDGGSDGLRLNEAAARTGLCGVVGFSIGEGGFGTCNQPLDERCQKDARDRSAWLAVCRTA